MEIPGWVVGGVALVSVFLGLREYERRGDLQPKHGAGLLGVGILAILLALFVGQRSVAFRKRAHDASRWTNTSGTILESRGESTFGRRTYGNTPDVSRGGVGISIQRNRTVDATIRYRYIVGTTTYTNDQVTPDNVRANDDVENWLKRYPKGATVTVRYNPTDPRVAVLEPGDSANQTAFGMALTFGLIGLLVSGFGVRLLAR